MLANLDRFEKFFLFLDIAPMSNARHIYAFGSIVDDIDNPVITNADSPFVIAALEFLATGRARRCGQFFEKWHNAGNHFSGQPMQFLVRAGG
jgi:hypothetical protein